MWGFKSSLAHHFLSEIVMNYSVEILKRSVFHDELVNVIGTMPPEKVDANLIAVRDYLTKRMKEIDRNTK